MTDFKELNLSTKILKALDKKNYLKPTPIQKQSIPHLLAGKDLLGIAQTGTGKTAAFSLPLLDNLSKSNKKVSNNHIRSLILTPTRELASQIALNIRGYGYGFNLRSEIIFGGVSINPQIKNLRPGLDIVVATPGRLLDLMNQGHIKLSEIEVFILDEADRMLDMGFIHDIKKIIKHLPKIRQTLFFSATMPNTISSLANSILTNPITVEITPQATTVDKIDQKVNLVEKANKLALLKSIIVKEEAETVLVFTKTKHGANKVVKHLDQQGIKAEAIHGNKSQSAREKALDAFRVGKIKVLIATDIMARGIDVKNITHVINFDIPVDPESYVHRIGRTARAEAEGVAISFCDPSEFKLLKAVEKVIKYDIPRDNTHPFYGVKAKPVTTSHSRNHSANNGKSNTTSTPHRKKSTSDDKAPKKQSFFSRQQMKFKARHKK